MAGAFESREPRVVFRPREELITTSNFFHLERRTICLVEILKPLDIFAGFSGIPQARNIRQSACREGFIGHQ